MVPVVMVVVEAITNNNTVEIVAATITINDQIIKVVAARRLITASLATTF